jgi:hypothetical protein
VTIERAFCRNKEHLSAFRAYGLPDKLIWLDGRGAETLDRCLDSFRGRPGKLLVAPDLRVFGKSSKAVEATMARLEKARIRVVDVIHPQHETVSEMLGFARLKIATPRLRDRRTARRRGAQGGLANGEAARSRRARIDTDTLILNLVAEKDVIGWAVIRRVCGGEISEATLRRHYLAAPKRKTKRGRKK